MAIGRVNTGGGGSGGTLTVTGIAGHTVTATKGGKTYTRTFNSGGVAVFKGLSTGTWTLTMTGDGQTSTKTIKITSDYSTSIAYFSATISITYPAKSTCVVKNSGGTTVASNTNTGTSAKTWTATVNATGTYTVTATATDGSGKSKSQSVSITADGQSESVTLSYELVILNGSTGNGSSNWEAAAVGNGSVSFSSSAGIVVDPNGWTPRVISSKAWDLTNYTTLTFYISRPSNSMNIRCGVGSPHADYGYITDWDAYTDTTSQDTSFTVVVDISSITSTYIGMEFEYGTKATISKIIAS